jgi:hypothetical protein
LFSPRFKLLTLAQSATTSLRGTVYDAKGLVVAGANVTLSNAATGFSRSTTTDGQGAYQFLELPPANYVLTIGAPGFAKVKRENVVLQVSSPATLNVALQVQGSSVVVDVSGEAPMVNTTDATLGNNFNCPPVDGPALPRVEILHRFLACSRASSSSAMSPHEPAR